MYSCQELYLDHKERKPLTPELTISDLKTNNPLEDFRSSLVNLKLEELLILISVLTNEALTRRNTELENKSKLLKPKKNILHA